MIHFPKLRAGDVLQVHSHDGEAVTAWVVVVVEETVDEWPEVCFLAGQRLRRSTVGGRLRLAKSYYQFSVVPADQIPDEVHAAYMRYMLT